MEADGKTETRKDRETRVKSKMKSEKLKISQFTAKAQRKVKRWKI